jgi:rare lipoprotein A
LPTLTVLLAGCLALRPESKPIVEPIAIPDTLTAPRLDGPDVETDLVHVPQAELPADTLLLPVKERESFFERIRTTLIGTGHASYYGMDFAGRRTANGERFEPNHLTAAHRTLPFGSLVRVTNLENGKSVVVRINDRGPFHPRRVIDLSLGAAKAIDMVRKGMVNVKLELLPPQDS